MTEKKKVKLIAGRNQKRPPLGKRVVKLEQSLKELKREFELYQDQQSQKLVALGETLQVIYENQLELSSQETKLDKQHAVLGRMAISNLNEILVRIGSEDLITYKSVNELFEQFVEFKERSDFRQHMHAWYMGEDLDSLPPPPEPVGQLGDDEEEPIKAEEPAEPKVFGGDYVESDNGIETAEEEQSEAKEVSEEDALPPGQDTDSASPRGTTVPAM